MWSAGSGGWRACGAVGGGAGPRPAPPEPGGVGAVLPRRGRGPCECPAWLRRVLGPKLRYGVLAAPGGARQSSLVGADRRSRDLRRAARAGALDYTWRAPLRDRRFD